MLADICNFVAKMYSFNNSHSIFYSKISIAEYTIRDIFVYENLFYLSYHKSLFYSNSSINSMKKWGKINKIVLITCEIIFIMEKYYFLILS